MDQSRRRVVARILLVLAWTYATLCGAFLLVTSLDQPDYWRLVPIWARVVGVLFGVVILFLDTLWVLLFLRDLFRGEGAQYLLSRTPQGTARISLRAIQASLLRRVREMPEVIGAKIVVRRPGEKKLKVDVAYTTTDDRNAIHVSESLRTVLRERFGEIVQPEEGFHVEFDVRIDGLVPGPEKKREELPVPEEEAEPFTGPRYPID